MATLVYEDSCENDVTPVTVASEPQLASEAELPRKGHNARKRHNATLSTPPELQPQESISVRRDRSLTAFLFEEIVGQKLKCYEQWKLWLGLCICMTVIAIVAIVLASYYAV
eukprot:605222_1